MTKSFKAAIYETHGNPPEVLRIEERPWPTPGADEVVVEMRAAPTNLADLNAIEGKYPVRPALPATPGMEGAGVNILPELEKRSYPMPTLSSKATLTRANH